MAGAIGSCLQQTEIMRRIDGLDRSRVMDRELEQICKEAVTLEAVAAIENLLEFNGSPGILMVCQWAVEMNRIVVIRWCQKRDIGSLFWAAISCRHVETIGQCLDSGLVSQGDFERRFDEVFQAWSRWRKGVCRDVLKMLIATRRIEGWIGQAVCRNATHFECWDLVETCMKFGYDDPIVRIKYELLCGKGNVDAVVPGLVRLSQQDFEGLWSRVISSEDVRSLKVCVFFREGMWSRSIALLCDRALEKRDWEVVRDVLQRALELGDLQIGSPWVTQVQTQVLAEKDLSMERKDAIVSMCRAYMGNE